MRKIFVMAVFACFAAMNVNAQSEGTESKNEEMLRLTKAADENPTDWKAQFDAGMFLVNKGTEMYNPAQAEKYFERLFHLAMDLKKEVPDSVVPAAGMMLPPPISAMSRTALRMTSGSTPSPVRAATP